MTNIVHAITSRKASMVLTHIEVRRVQNGFVIMGFNATRDYVQEFAPEMRRVCFVANDVESLVNTIKSLTEEASDFVWRESIDIPITDLFSRKVEE